VSPSSFAPSVSVARPGPLRTLGRALAVQLWSAMVPWRWLLAALVFAVCAFLEKSQLDSSFFNEGITRPVDAWDMFPGLQLRYSMVYLLWGFGFLIFVLDTYHRGRDDGTLSLAFVRLPSRPLYWLATMGAVGVTALGYVTLAFVIALLVGMVVAPPASLWPMLPREGDVAMYPSWNVSVPTYSLLLVGYTAWALWVTGCTIVFLSLFVRRKAVLLGFVVAWNTLSFATIHSLAYLDGFGLLNIGYLVGMFKHHIQSPFPMGQFFAVTAAALVLMAVVGAWKMRREEP
jgi:hypothetical protein